MTFNQLIKPRVFWNGGIAQLGERVLCKHEVVGSIPSASTRNLSDGWRRWSNDQGSMPDHSPFFIVSSQDAPSVQRLFEVRDNITSLVISFGMSLAGFLTS